MRHFTIYIASLFVLTFFSECNNSNPTDSEAEQIALNLANNIDSNSLKLFKEYSYSRRGDNDFWQKLSADTTLYSCSYKVSHDTAELTIFRPLNFINDFTSAYHFDTSIYYQFTFFKLFDNIVKILSVDNHGQDHFQDTLVSTKQLFPNRNPFDKFSELTEINNKLKFIGTSYRSDIGELFEFWITPQYKLTFLPDTSMLNPKFKKYCLDDFTKGEKIKEHWSLQKVYE